MKKSLTAVGVAAVILLTACGGTSEKASEQPPQQTEAASPATPAEPAAKTVEAPAPVENQTEVKEVSKAEQKITKVGEKTTLEDWDFTVQSFKIQDKVSDDNFSSTPEAGTKFGVVNILATNNGSAAGWVVSMGNSATLVYNDKYEYNYTRTMISGDFNFETVDPLQDKKGFIVFQLPDKAANDANGKFKLVIEHENGARAEFALN